MEYLKKREIGTLIHYPIPPHLSEAYAYLGYKKGDFPITEQYVDEVLSLPMYNGMTEEEHNIVINAINEPDEYIRDYDEFARVLQEADNENI